MMTKELAIQRLDKLMDVIKPEIAEAIEWLEEQTEQSDTISRRAAFDCVNRAVTKEAARWAIQQLPSAQPERKTGKWIDIGGVIRWGCTKCHHAYEHKYNYCPHCGARMVERI